MRASPLSLLRLPALCGWRHHNTDLRFPRGKRDNTMKQFHDDNSWSHDDDWITYAQLSDERAADHALGTKTLLCLCLLILVGIGWMLVSGDQVRDEAAEAQERRGLYGRVSWEANTR